MSVVEDTWSCYFCAWDNVVSSSRCGMCTSEKLGNCRESKSKNIKEQQPLGKKKNENQSIQSQSQLQSQGQIQGQIQTKSQSQSQSQLQSQSQSQSQIQEKEQGLENGNDNGDGVMTYLQFTVNDPVEYFDEDKNIWSSGIYMGNDGQMSFIGIGRDGDDIACVKNEWVRFPLDIKSSSSSSLSKDVPIKKNIITGNKNQNKETPKGPSILLEDKNNIKNITTNTINTNNKNNSNHYIINDKEESKSNAKEIKNGISTTTTTTITSSSKKEETKENDEKEEEKEEEKKEEEKISPEDEEEEKKMDPLIVSTLKMDKTYTETDDWENVNDFVFSEYIRDIVHTIPDLLKDLDQFISKMEVLGVHSERSRSRALGLLDGLKSDIETQKMIDAMQENMTEEEKIMQRRYLMAHKAMETPGFDKERPKALIVDETLAFGDPKSNICVRCEEIETVAWNIYHLRQCQHAYCINCFKGDMKKWVRTKKEEIYTLTHGNKKTRTKYRRLKGSKKKEIKKNEEDKKDTIEISIPSCATCKTPILLEDVELFLNDADLIREMRKLLEWNPKDKKNVIELGLEKKSEKKKKKKKKKHSDSDSESGSDKSGSDSDSNSDSDSDSGSSDSSGDDKDPFYYCYNYEEACDGKVKRNRKKKFVCPKCERKNCAKCKTIHPKPETCDSFSFLYKHPFLRCWQDKKAMKMEKKKKKQKKNSDDDDDDDKNKNKKNDSDKEKDKKKEDNEIKPLFDNFSKKMCESHRVKRNSKEWKRVVSNIADGRNVIRIERVQNAKLWRNYQKYCQRLSEKQKSPIDERYVWHGTRATEPGMLWRGSGFDLAFARVGGCLWFAVENSYSMGGFQYTNPATGESQVFLALVACGNAIDCKIIQSGRGILNVYKNEATYPAYVVTYR